MKSLLFCVLAVFALSACSSAQNKGLKIPVATSAKAQAGEAVATFAEGCFWHSEIVFQSLYGVRDAVSGFSGGHAVNPSYEAVCTGATGHAEAVNVYYDPSKITYAQLVDAFFASMNPTQLNRQGNDVGTEYRSAAFYRNEAEKQILQAAVKKLADSKKYSGKIVTEIQPFKAFYSAEAYHQEYIFNNPGNSYVQNVSIPDFAEFKKHHKAKYKD